MHNTDDLPGRDTVQRVAEPGRITAFVDLQAPRHGRRAAVQLLVEVVAEPADGLGQDDARCDRITERRQRDPALPAPDPRAHRTQRDRTPDTQAAVPDAEGGDQTGATLTEVRGPVGHHVIEPPTDQTERHRPERDVVDHSAFTTAGRPPAITDHQRGDDAGDDAQRIRPQRHAADEPHTLIRTGDIGQRGHRHARTACRTPSANSVVSVRSASTPSSNADTRAEPTMTPSA